PGPTGSLAWETTLDAAVEVPPTVGPANVYVSTADERIHALDRTTGERQWAVELSSVDDAYASLPIAVGGGRMYTTGLNPGTHAYDAGSGEQVWTSEFSSRHAPLFESGYLYGALFFGIPTPLVARNAETGELAWKQQVDGPTMHQPTIHENTLYASVFRAEDTNVKKSAVHAIDLVSGDERWSTRLDDGRYVSSPAVDGDGVYVADAETDTGAVRALSREGGESVWRKTFTAVQKSGDVDPVAADGRVYVPGRRLLALDAATGEVVWSNDDSRVRFATSVERDGDRLLVTTDTLVTVDPASGKIVEAVDTPDGIRNAVAGPDRVFGSDDSGRVVGVWR
ncbi:MAG: PQQ-binding-like beta-propeller repeat protein, partial [Haloarculaceae archaeon]